MKDIYYLLIVAGVLILILIGLFIVEKTIVSNKKKQVLKKLSTLGKIEKDGQLYFLIIDSKQVQLIFLPIKNNQYLTINSPEHMQIDNSKDKNPIILKYDYSKGIYKWLLVVPGFNRVKKAINENEVVFISYKDEFDNFRIIRENEIDTFILDNVSKGK